MACESKSDANAGLFGSITDVVELTEVTVETMIRYCGQFCPDTPRVPALRFNSVTWLVQRGRAVNLMISTVSLSPSELRTDDLTEPASVELTQLLFGRSMEKLCIFHRWRRR